MKIKAERKEEPVVAETNAIATVTGEGLHGEWTKRDVEIPELKLVQPMSQFDADFPNGAFVHGGDTMISEGLGKRITVYPLELFKWYELLTPFDGDEQPRMWLKEQDAIDEGYCEGNTDGCYSPVGAAVLLIPVDPELAHYEHAGQGYVKTKIVFRKTNFKLASRLFTAGLKNDSKHHFNQWELDSKRIDGRKGKWWVPLLFNKGASPDEVRKWIEEEVMA